jgi:putative NADH-flavin reductase
MGSSVRIGAVFVAMLLGASRLASATTVVVYGASGAIGGQIVNEALSRGYDVVGVARELGKMPPPRKGFTAKVGDVTDVESFKTLTQGADAVIISVSGGGKDNAPENSTAALAAKTAIAAFTDMPKAPYVIEIGGATTMYENKDDMLAHLPFPAPAGSPMYGMFLGHLVALESYRASNIDWCVLTPPFDIEGMSRDGKLSPKRTGKYRTSTTSVVLDTDGKSHANIADLAVAAVDEVAQKKFVRQRFTIGY